jgi:hypothetical protein
MALVITNRYHLNNCLLILALMSIGCRPGYFSHPIMEDIHKMDHPDLKKYLPSGFPDDVDIYSMEMNPYNYYKNNIEGSILLSKNSSHTKRVRFFKQVNQNLPQKFQKFEVWLSKKDSTSTSLMQGEPAVMASFKGKTDSTGVKYELVKVYVGSFHEKPIIDHYRDTTIMVFKPEYLLDYTGKSNKCTKKKCEKRNAKAAKKPAEQKNNPEPKDDPSDKKKACNRDCHKVTRKLTKQQGSTELNMEAYVELKNVDSGKIKILQFNAIMDFNFNSYGAEKAIMYDFTEIFGEPVWLIKN